MDLADLHDAILESVAIRVDDGTVTLGLTRVQFGGAGKQVTLLAREWTSFSCPKHEPWGRATAWRVNEARGPSALESGMQHVELEMQSGDVIEIDATRIERVDESPVPSEVGGPLTLGR
jgi:hypothetical protein